MPSYDKGDLQRRMHGAVECRLQRIAGRDPRQHPLRRIVEQPQRMQFRQPLGDEAARGPACRRVHIPYPHREAGAREHDRPGPADEAGADDRHPIHAFSPTLRNPRAT